MKYSYIGSLNSSAKIAKGLKYGIQTFIVYLAPYKLSGFNVCAKAVAECIKGCLFSSGQSIMNSNIAKVRIAKTKDFYNHRDEFVARLFKEIESAKRKVDKQGLRFAVRLNGTSDLSPELFKLNGKNVLETFPDTVFYDYTKLLNRTKLKQKYPNYDLTFSYTGHNWNECKVALQDGVRVAVVFNVKRNHPLPESFNGYPVIDGDLNDYRPDDPGCIVGLRWKKIKNKKAEKEVLNSSFVVKV